VGGVARSDGSWQSKVLDLRDEEEPLLSLMANNLDVIPNVMADTGFVALEIDDAPAEVDKAAAWLKKREPRQRRKRDRIAYGAEAEIEITKAPPSWGGPPNRKYRRFCSRTVVSNKGLAPSVKRTFKTICLSFES
jgi:hypothetical protein